MSATTYTAEQLSGVINSGVDLVIDGLGIGGESPEADAIALVANSIMLLLEKPEASIEDVANESYGLSFSEIQSWWSWS
ncbi:hypothetical protein ABWK57_13910 [Streptomyces sp. NPDC094045]|uniref:hypothetical protein n=1 Tax=unclassified Streptomyces TaxID=2593676 RepID=UPI003398655E